MKQYFLYLSTYNGPKNSLQAALIKYLEKETNKIVDANDFIKKLTADVDSMNAEFKRCKPLKVDAGNRESGSIGISFSHEWTVGLYLYPVKGNL